MTVAPYRVIASNLHVGGGVQVAASLLDEAAAMGDEPRWSDLLDRTVFEVSPMVARNTVHDTLGRLPHIVRHRRPGDVSSLARDTISRSRASLSLFGPVYSRPRAKRRLMGYADVTSIYPPITGHRTWKGRARARLSLLELTMQDLVIVETVAMRSRIIQELGGRAPEIRVVPNAVNGRVLSASRDDQLAGTISAANLDAGLTLAYPTRDYPHKNLEFLPRVARELARRGHAARFVVTLKSEEWHAKSADFRDACINVGEVTVDQVATLLTACDGLFFPSLLEAYSATPVEAMALATPVFASDRDFVRTVCGDAAIYFDPNDASAAAESVVAALTDGLAAQARVELGLQLVRDAPTAKDRAGAMLEALYDLPPPEAV